MTSDTINQEPLAQGTLLGKEETKWTDPSLHSAGRVHEDRLEPQRRFLLGPRTVNYLIWE